MKASKIVAALVILGLFISVVHSMSRWSEDRKIFDDICYLVQAHLFGQYGAKGLDTSLALDGDAAYLNEKLKQIGRDVSTNVCHHYFEAGGKKVMQYPPGTGFVLSLFPPGFQVVPLYVVCTTLLLFIVLGSIFMSCTVPALTLATLFGWVSLYTMINPAKSSFSVPGSVVIGAIVGVITAILFQSKGGGWRVTLLSIVGLLLGLSVNLRIANALLASGYFIVLISVTLLYQNRERLLEVIVFGGSFFIGLIPTLLSNYINVGSPFRTTYTSLDVVPPNFSILSIMRQASEYLSGAQGLLLVASIFFLAVGLLRAGGGLWRASVLVFINLAANMIFYVTHPIVTPYYAFSIVTMSLWTLLWSYILEERFGDGTAAEARAA